jgi:hypothetical protein
MGIRDFIKALNRDLIRVECVKCGRSSFVLVGSRCDEESLCEDCEVLIYGFKRL